MTARAAGGSIVAVMAKEPAPGRTKTRLSPPLSLSEAAHLYEALLNDTINLVSRVHGVRLGVAITRTVTETWQPRVPDDALVFPVRGADIGACLQQATSWLFAAGFSHVIVLNSDGPTLPAGRIATADRLLRSHDIVLGPGEDGGYYLIGLCRAVPDLFTDIAWSTSSVAAQTLDRAAALGLSVARLPPWYDVDTPADLARLLAEAASLPPSALPCTRRFLAITASTEHFRDKGRPITTVAGPRRKENSG